MPVVSNFEFELGQEVLLTISRAKGTIVGRGEHLTDENEYLVRYATFTGCQRDDWFKETAIEAA